MRFAYRRTLSTVVAATALVISGLLSGSTPALANKDCNPNQSADVSLTQTLTNTTPSESSWTFLKEVTAINGGPCHVPAVTFTDVLPSGATAVNIVTSPNSWSCPPTPATGTLVCTSTASMGVPGTQTFDITFTMAPTTGNVTDAAYITTSGVRDPLLLNNCSIVGYVGSGGGTVGTGNTQTGTETCGFLDPTSSSQVEQVTFVGFAGGVQITERAASCAGPGRIGIGRCTDFFYQGSSDFTKVFVMNLAAITAAGSSYSSVGLFWEGFPSLGFPATTLSSCNGPQATNPCITDKSKFKNGGATFVRLTIQGTNIPDGGYGWQ
jgi:hypothetical protein